MMAVSEIICKISSDESQIFFKTRLANNLVSRVIHLVQGGPLQGLKP